MLNQRRSECRSFMKGKPKPSLLVNHWFHKMVELTLILFILFLSCEMTSLDTLIQSTLKKKTLLNRCVRHPA